MHSTLNLPSPPDPSTLLDAYLAGEMSATARTLTEVFRERRHQIEDCGWTTDHDDLHGLEGFAWLCARRAVEMSNSSAVHAVDCRRLFVEIAAIAVAAVEALDRADTKEPAA